MEVWRSDARKLDEKKYCIFVKGFIKEHVSRVVQLKFHALKVIDD